MPVIDFGIFFHPCSRYFDGDIRDQAFFRDTQSGLSISAAHHVVFFTTPVTRLSAVASIAVRGLSLLGAFVANQFFVVLNRDDHVPDP